MGRVNRVLPPSVKGRIKLYVCVWPAAYNHWRWLEFLPILTEEERISPIDVCGGMGDGRSSVPLLRVQIWSIRKCIEKAS